jgi:hypothetical protein
MMSLRELGLPCPVGPDFTKATGYKCSGTYNASGDLESDGQQDPRNHGLGGTASSSQI